GLPPGDAAVAAVGEEQGLLSAHRAQADIVDGLHAGGLELLARDRLEVQVPATVRAVAVGGEHLVDLLPDLVATAPGPRTDRGLERPVGTKLTQRLHALAHDPAGQPAPAG